LRGIGGVSGRRQRDHGGGEDEAKHGVLLFCWLGNPLVPATRLRSLRELRRGLVAPKRTARRRKAGTQPFSQAFREAILDSRLIPAFAGKNGVCPKQSRRP
jgi:hypothetical protein